MSVASERREKWKRRREAAKTGRALLVERFPRCFCAKGEPKRPLKLGIHKDLRIAAPDIPRRMIVFALADYTSGLSYLRAIQIGASRVDLEGWPAGEVSIPQAKAAREQLERIESKITQRRAPDAQDLAA
ncbi:ProQ/FINO family protein [Ancylobacter sp.]|uniref:ProQ/FINO family protein n=1 Tax=Ancylobacter sp. TaxID=1872567 RepID=UPI003D0AF42B